MLNRLLVLFEEIKMPSFILRLICILPAIFIILASVSTGANFSPSIDQRLADPACSDSIISVIVFAEVNSEAMAAKAAR